MVIFPLIKILKNLGKKKKSAGGFENLWVGQVWADKPFFFGLTIP